MDYENLGKTACYFLRHRPQEGGIVLDDNGAVEIEELVEALNRRGFNATYDDVLIMAEEDSKGRYAIEDGKIRALYGHSFRFSIKREEEQPPDILYHGTSHRAYESIKVEGLRPMSRQTVHMSPDPDIAYEVGLRYDDEPLILVVDAGRAYEDGVAFYYGNERTWLADAVPAEYLSILE